MSHTTRKDIWPQQLKHLGMTRGHSLPVSCEVSSAARGRSRLILALCKILNDWFGKPTVRQIATRPTTSLSKEVPGFVQVLYALPALNGPQYAQ